MLQEGEKDLRAEEGLWVEVTSQKVAVVTGRDDTLARDAHAARLADYIARHVVYVSCRRLTANLHRPHQQGICTYF